MGRTETGTILHQVSSQPVWSVLLHEWLYFTRKDTTMTDCDKIGHEWLELGYHCSRCGMENPKFIGETIPPKPKCKTCGKERELRADGFCSENCYRQSPEYQARFVRQLRAGERTFSSAAALASYQQAREAVKKIDSATPGKGFNNYSKHARWAGRFYQS